MLYLLAHDLGTSGNKAVLYDHNGNFIIDQQYNYDTLHSEHNYAEQDPLSWWEAVCKCTKKIIEKAGISNKQIAGLSFSGHMNCMLPLDNEGNALTKALIWSDQRSQKEFQFIKEAIGLNNIYKITGHRINASYVVSKIQWLQNNYPEIYKKVAKISQAKDFIVYKLTGNYFTDFSEASHLGLFDLTTKKWSQEILKELNIPEAILNIPRKSTDIVGTVTKEASMFCGILEGTPVIIGGGDGCCATAGSGIFQLGKPYNIIGTSSWIAFLKETPLFDEEMRTFNFIHLDGQNYLPCGTMQSAGFSLNWLLTQVLGNPEANSLDDLYNSLESIVHSVKPGSNNLIFLPYLLGERCPWWNSNATAAFFGLTASHSKNEIIRAVLEGVGYNLKIILDIFQETQKIDNLRVIGGGARNNYWLNILADIWQIPIEIPKYLEQATSIGAIACAGIGLDIFKGFDIVETFNPTVSIIKPNEVFFKKYNKLYQIFKKLYFQIEPLFDELKES